MEQMFYWRDNAEKEIQVLFACLVNLTLQLDETPISAIHFLRSYLITWNYSDYVDEIFFLISNMPLISVDIDYCSNLSTMNCLIY